MSGNLEELHLPPSLYAKCGGTQSFWKMHYLHHTHAKTLQKRTKAISLHCDVCLLCCCLHWRKCLECTVPCQVDRAGKWALLSFQQRSYPGLPVWTHDDSQNTLSTSFISKHYQHLNTLRFTDHLAHQFQFKTLSASMTNVQWQQSQYNSWQTATIVFEAVFFFLGDDYRGLCNGRRRLHTGSSP